VVGWYSEPELDCLYPKALQEAFNQEKYNALNEEDMEAVFPEEIAKSAPYALKSVPAPRYWQPNEPVVLIVNEVGQTVRPTLRHGRDVGLRKGDV
jgi:hypothetical protein